MRVLDIQAKMRRAGVIRLGDEKPANGPGKRLTTFRLTSNDRHQLEVAAARYGGEVRAWAGGSQRWQVVTKTEELPIEIGNIPATTAYEFYAQVGGTGSKQCIRRCDGCNILEGIERGNPCKCPTDPLERAQKAKQKNSTTCSLVCRLFVRLPEVPDVGLWQVTTGSFYAAQEVPAIMDGIEALAQMGAHLRAKLAIEVRKGGGKTFPVLAVRMTQTNDELRALAMHHFEQMRALEGADRLTQVAFKLGIPMTTVNGQPQPDAAALAARNTAQPLPPRQVQQEGGQGGQGGPQQSRGLWEGDE